MKAVRLFRMVWLAVYGLLFVFLARDVSAQVNVNSVIFTFTATGRPVQNVVVSNSSSAPIYVSTKSEAMIDFTKTPVQVGPTEDLLISPKNFAIEANGTRTVRVLLRKPSSEVERGYRVYFIPQENEFGGKTITQSEQGRTAVIKVATGVGVLVFVNPIESKVDFKQERDPLGITFVNQGNVQVYLGDGKACPSKVEFPAMGAFSDGNTGSHSQRHPDTQGCFSIPSRRVYPGTKFRVPVSSDKKVRYLKVEGADGKYEILDIPSLTN